MAFAESSKAAMVLRRPGSPQAVLLIAYAVVLLVPRLGVAPPLCFDEGWVLSLARNWVERGHYGHLLMGQPVPATIPFTGMPAVAPAALSFRLFGVGTWQARLPGVLFTLATLLLLYHLARRLYDQKIAVGTLASALLLSMFPDLHPIFIGRQALGEMSAMLCLLLGFVFLYEGWRKPACAVPLASLFWALSIRTKPQVLPFFIASLLVPTAMAAWKRNWRTVRLLTVHLLAALGTSIVLTWGQDALLRSRWFAPTSGHDVYSWMDNAANYLYTLVLVVDLTARVKALLALAFSAPTVLGLIYAARNLLRRPQQTDLDDERHVCRVALLTFSVTSLGWFVVLSSGFGRYLFPAGLVGNVFVAVLLRDIFGGFYPLRLLKAAARGLKERRHAVRTAGLLACGIAFPVALLVTPIMLAYMYLVGPDDSLSQVASYLNTQTRAESVIETYEAELFFLLERPVHYPPDRVQDEINRRHYLLQDTTVNYDPLSADPDYVVVGYVGRIGGLYDEVLEKVAFHLSFENSGYQVYERLRSASSSDG